MREVVEIDFKDVYPIWKNDLWPGRKSSITKTSAIKWRRGINMDYLDRKAFFFGIYGKDDLLIAVCSCFPTEMWEFRMRGLWVHPQYRGRGLSRLLVKKIIDCVFIFGGKKLWSLPKADLKPLYIKFGFSKFYGPVNKFEFGPHYWAMMFLSSAFNSQKEPIPFYLRGLKFIGVIKKGGIF